MIKPVKKIVIVGGTSRNGSEPFLASDLIKEHFGVE